MRGRDLELALADDLPADGPGGLSALDGFADVDIELVSFRAGPFAVSAFVLERRDGGTYALAARARAGAGDLARLGSGHLPGGRLLGAIPVPAVIAGAEVPISVEAELASSTGELRVISGGGTVAGYPAGRIAAEIAAAVSQRLEIVP